MRASLRLNLMAPLSHPCLEVAAVSRPRHAVRLAVAEASGGRIGAKEPDLGGGVLESPKRRFCPCQLVDGEVQVEAVLERSAAHWTAVQASQVHAPAGKAVEGQRKAARPVGGDESHR